MDVLFTAGMFFVDGEADPTNRFILFIFLISMLSGMPRYVYLCLLYNSSSNYSSLLLEDNVRTLYVPSFSCSFWIGDDFRLSNICLRRISRTDQRVGLRFWTHSPIHLG